MQTGKWSAPTFITDPYLRIHGMAPGLNYGVQCFEGMKAFRTPENKIAIFRPDQNAKRMQVSASYIAIPLVPIEHFLECVRLAVGLNAEYVPPHETGAAMYVRPMLFASSAQLGLNPAEEYTFAVYVMATGVYHGVKPVDGLTLEEFDRSAPRGTGAAKVGGNYAPVLPWSQKAYSEGYGITLHLDSKTNTEIEEFSTSAFLGAKKEEDGYLITIPESKNAIKSVTQDSVCQIAQSRGWKVVQRRVLYEELPSFSEVLACGTAAALVPLKSIYTKSKDEKIVYLKDDEPGPVCRELLQTYKNIQSGKIKDPYEWLDYVSDPAEWKKANVTAQANGVNGTGSVDMAA